MEREHRSWQSLMELLESDSEYQALERQRQEKLAAFQAVLGTLTESQRDTVIEYIGISEEQGWRALELAYVE